MVPHTDHWQEILFPALTVHNLYFSPGSAKDRRNLLAALRSHLSGSNGQQLICGDFNLAPQPEVGVFGDAISTFITAGERNGLANLLQAGGLCDVMAARNGLAPEFTFERMLKGKRSCFRCDLAL